MKIFKYIISIVCMWSVLFLLNGCQRDCLFVDSFSFDKAKWNYNQPVIWEVDVEDTINTHHLSLFMRNNLEYPYSNIYFFTSIIYNDSVFLSDTSQYLIADKYGRWLGRGFGGLKDNYFLMKENVVFPKRGKYTIRVTHGMRADDLQGVEDLGIKIKNTF